MSATADLGRRTWTDLADHGDTLLAVPLGSCEQHGPHLPLDTDTVIATAVAHGLAGARPDVLVTPAVSLTASGEHHGFPGTLSIGTEVLSQLLVELVRSADWAAGVIMVNGHGGNLDAVRQAQSICRAEGRQMVAWWPTPPPQGDAHAGRTETSVMLALAPHLVRDDRPTGATKMLNDLWPELRRGGVAAVSPSGVLGDARGAHADEGRQILEAWIADLIAQVDQRWPAQRP